jgi:hypothetical protein
LKHNIGIRINIENNTTDGPEIKLKAGFNLLGRRLSQNLCKSDKKEKKVGLQLIKHCEICKIFKTNYEGSRKCYI